ncbi:NAD-dependent succinate-semialdehyde dehydrogenase [Methylopila musalis]|uniref:NAD-dependent succinate-semialdehyde dehydrogenase n=1 Tax=Methylopila musalis TaxID=1134781 RepID=A0ABW3Z5P2_9HYPH
MDGLNDPSLLVARSFVDGRWIGEGDVSVTDPATGDVLAHVPNLGAAAATEAVEAASRAFKPWAAKLAKERSALLRRWFDLILANKDDLARIMSREQGKPLAEARGEIDYGASFVEFFAEEAKRINGDTLPSHRADARVLVLRQPVGVVAAITPWNFPAAMITRKCAPALAAGCTVVVKPAMETPLTALALAKLAEQAGFPAGVLNIVTGDAKPIGEVFTSHPAVRVVSFTGSTPVGKELMRQSAGTVKRVALELGGNAPFIVFDDADLDAAVEGAMVSKYRNMGQTCVCANRIYVQSGVYDAFAEKLVAAVAKLKVGHGIDDGVTQGPLITPKAVEKVERLIEDATAKGATALTGGKRHALGGSFFEPTVLAGLTQDMAIAQEEIFGPVAPLFRFDTEDEVVAYANATEYGLAAYFYARDVGRIFRVGEALEYGMVGINSGIISSEIAPFGGVKESGQGREGSQRGVDEFVDIKYLLVAGLAG